MTSTPPRGRRVPPDATALAALLAEYDTRLKALERSSSLARSSIENGSLKAKVGGALTMVLGAQYDGTNAAVSVTGPNPPVPTAPTLTPKVGAATVRWDGLWQPVGGDTQVVAPMDFARVEIHASTDPAFLADTISTLVGTYETPRGGDQLVPIPISGQDHTIKLVARSLSGKRSAASVGAVVSAEDVGATNYRGPNPPWPDGAPGHADDEGDIWYDTTLSDGPETRIHRKALTGNVATLTVDRGHGVQTGSLINVFGIGAPFVATPPQPFTVVSTGVRIINPGTADEEQYDTISYSVVAANVPEAMVESVEANVQGVGTGPPRNRPSIWDGDSWVLVQDSGVNLALTLLDKAAVKSSANAEDIAAARTEILSLTNTATDIQRTAYAADGRINISDYEPTPEDMLDAAGQPKNEGSLWITRTRDRRNYCACPSFEVGTSPWSYTNTTTAARTAAVGFELAGEGGYYLRVQNNAVVGDHVADYGLVSGAPVEPGQEWTVSGYVALPETAFTLNSNGDYVPNVVGQGAGITVSLTFLDNADTPLATFTSAPVTAGPATMPWQRPYVTGVAPAGATKVRAGRFNNPNPNEVWYLDAVLIELNPRLGRYFDGGSKGGDWTNPEAPGLSVSVLDGGAIIRFFSLEDGGWKEKWWTKDTINSLNAGVIVGDDAYVRPARMFTNETPPRPTPEFDGGLLADGSVALDKMVTGLLQCAEDVFAGALVNVPGEEYFVRLAQAVPGREAYGFVLEAAQTGQWVKVYSYGYDPLMVDLSPGPQFLSTSPGKASASAPTESGTIAQRVGYASDPTTLHFHPTLSVTIV